MVMPTVWDEERGAEVSRYLQSARLNPEHAGKARGFAPLSDAQAGNAFLQHVVRKCFDALPWRVHVPVFIGVHIVQLAATPGVPAVSSPDSLHRDGEPFTWAFLLSRVNAAGGENIIALPEMANKQPGDVPAESIHARFTLEKPFEGWVVDDKKVSHYVSPVSAAPGASEGSRTVLLIDYTPAAPDMES